MDKLEIELVAVILSKTYKYFPICYLVCKRWLDAIKLIPNKRNKSLLSLAETGDIHILEWLKPYYWDERLCYYAASNNKLDALIYLLSLDCPVNDKIYNYAAKYGHVNIIKWLKTNTTLKLNIDACNMAARHGKFSVMKYIRQCGVCYDTSTCAAAAEGGHGNIISYLKNNGYPWDETTCEAAARTGRLQLLISLRNHGCPWDKNTLSEAIRYNKLTVVFWCLENGLSYENAYFTAIWCDRLDILTYLCDNYPRPKESYTFCSEAAKCGNLNIFKWLVNSGYLVHIDTYINATKYNNLPILKYIASNLRLGRGINWKEAVINTAIEHNHINIFTWAVKRSPGIVLKIEIIRILIKRGDLETLRWIDRNTTFIANNFMCKYSIDYKKYEIFKYLISKGCKVTRDIYIKLINDQRLDILQWLDKQFINIDLTQESSDITELIFFHNNIPLLKWIIKHHCPVTLNLFLKADIELLMWLDNQDLPVAWKDVICKHAIITGNLPKLVWAINKGCPLPNKADNLAAAYRKMEVFKWLIDYKKVC